MPYHVEAIPNRGRRPTILLRKAWRDGNWIRRETLADLPRLPPAMVEGVRRVVKGGVAFRKPDETLRFRRSLPHGHVCAVLDVCRRLDPTRIPHPGSCRERDLALAAIILRVLAPNSKLAAARQLSPCTATSSLGAVLGLVAVSGNEMLSMLDWLQKRQAWIEKSVANPHLKGGTLVPYDVTSRYLEARRRPLAAFGHDRDGTKGKKRIVFGLLCSRNGCPMAVEVLPGNAPIPTMSPRKSRGPATDSPSIGSRWWETAAC